MSDWFALRWSLSLAPLVVLPARVPARPCDDPIWPLTTRAAWRLFLRQSMDATDFADMQRAPRTLTHVCRYTRLLMIILF